MAAHAGIPKYQVWAPLGTVLYGIVGGVPLFAIGLGTTVHYLKTSDKKSAAPDSHTPMILLLNAGWILTALAVIKVLVLK
ncbi:MAG: hypothetical protein ACPGVU_23535 [Limisphaerales bacterium]